MNKMSMLNNQSVNNPIFELFEDHLYTELFNARCHDTGEAANSKL